MTCTVLKATGQVVGRRPLNLCVCCFSHGETGAAGLGEEGPRCVGPFSSHLINGAYGQHGLLVPTLSSSLG